MRKNSGDGRHAIISVTCGTLTRINSLKLYKVENEPHKRFS